MLYYYILTIVVIVWSLFLLSPEYLSSRSNRHEHARNEDGTSVTTKRTRGFSTNFSVKVDVHFNNGVLERSPGENGYQTTGKAEIAREPPEHAYEQICLRQDPDISGGNVTNTQRKTQHADNATDRR